MAITVIQNNSNNNSGRMGYMSSAVLGALSGYSLKWLLPLTTQEKDQNYLDELVQVKRNAWQAREAEIEKIRNEVPKANGADEFISMYDNNKLTSFDIKKVDEPLSGKLTALLERINNAALKVKTEGRENLIFQIKKIRPALTFISIGMGIALGIALIHNIFKETPQNFETVDYEY